MLSPLYFMVRRVNVALTRSVNVALSQYYYRYCQWMKGEQRIYCTVKSVFFFCSLTGLRHDDVLR
jgi:hypothetical protein